ncbi:MAG: c-type cytochrome biogenesis protein CcsB [Clostridiales bacterium]|nr:c-type cytochrome biogenesis protein CcsB [Clostridiales bacterium]
MEQAENILFTAAMAGYFLAIILNFVFIGLKKERAAKIAAWAQGAGLVLHTAALVIRGIAAGRVPMTNQYEFATCFAWALCLVSLVFIRKYRFSVLGVFAVPVVFLIMGYAAMQNREVRPLMAALQSNWLVFHVTTAILAYGSFGVSCVLGTIFLIRNRMKENGFLDQHIPASDKLDIIEYRSVCLGLLFLTITIITGAFWAQKCWGSYWSWDPKETWSLVTWIIYALYLHLRIMRGWKGKAAAIFAVVGFICVIFTYLGVNTFLPGLHSYA